MEDNKEVLTVTKLREKVKKTKGDSSDKMSKLQSILDTRKSKRETWDQEKKVNYDQFLGRLLEAHENYVESLKTKIVECAESILQKNLKAKSFKLWDPQNIKSDLKGFSEFTIYRGFWNNEKKKHDRLPHMEAGIKATPLVQVKRELEPLGYKVFDISDSSKSLHVVIEIKLNSKDAPVEEELVVDDVEEEVEVADEVNQEV